MDTKADLLSTTLFYLSTGLSLTSIFTGLLSVHLYSKHSTVGDLGKILLLALYMVTTTGRVLCLLLLAAPYLGLFGLLQPLVTAQRFQYSPDTGVSLAMVDNMRKHSWSDTLPYTF